MKVVHVHVKIHAAQKAIFKWKKKISGRMHKKLLEERFPLENDLLTFIICYVLRRENRILDL